MLPFVPAYSWLQATSEKFPVASTYQDKILSLPLYAELTEHQILYIAEVLKQSIKN